MRVIELKAYEEPKHGYQVKVAWHYPKYEVGYMSMTDYEASVLARHFERLLEQEELDDYIIERLESEGDR